LIYGRVFVAVQKDITAPFEISEDMHMTLVNPAKLLDGIFL
jgi:hypothetical protein